MDAILGLGCFCSSLLTLILILIPILWAKHRSLPPEHKAYRQTIHQIEADYHREMAVYQRLKQQNRIQSLSELMAMKPVDFEKHIAYVFQQMGYQAHETKYSGDGGIDVAARRHGQFVAIQCKRYAAGHKISSPELRNFIGAMAVNNADQGFFVTTSAFTRPARQEAAQIPHLTLVDGQGIVQWWQEYQIGPYRDLTPPRKRAYPPVPPPIPPVSVLGLRVWQWVTVLLLGQTAIFIFTLLLYMVMTEVWL